MTVKTWQLEMFAVATVLGAVVLVTHGGPLEVVGAAAVLLSFGHAQVAERLAEGECERQAFVRPITVSFHNGDPAADAHGVVCYWWAGRYLVGKESLWLVYFVLHHSWSALAGVGLFLAYPMWRRWWRVGHPMGR